MKLLMDKEQHRLQQETSWMEDEDKVQIPDSQVFPKCYVMPHSI
jgi:hypothetical protein